MNRQNERIWWFGLLFPNSLWSPHICPHPLQVTLQCLPLEVEYLSLSHGCWAWPCWFTLAKGIWIKVSVGQLQAEALIDILYFCSDACIHSRDAWGEVHTSGSYWSKKNEKAHGVYINRIHNLGKIPIKPRQVIAWSKLLKLTCRPMSKKNKFLLFYAFLKEFLFSIIVAIVH